jgi:hypothetical protein
MHSAWPLTPSGNKRANPLRGRWPIGSACQELLTNLRKVLGRDEDLKEFEEFELQGSPVRRFFTAAISRANANHP